MTQNEILYQEAKDAVEKLFNDKSVSEAECVMNLKGLRDEIDMMISGFKE